MKDSTAIGLGCAFVIGLAAAFIVGVMIGGRPVTRHEATAHVNAGNTARPNPFSPNPAHDPYFIDQQRKNVEALERSCRRTGKYCREAAQLRQWLAENGAVP
jgi:hypothetical protein